MNSSISFDEKLFDERVIPALESVFTCCYECIRVWSAWSYNTMSIEDFCSYDHDDESFFETYTALKQEVVSNPNTDVSSWLINYLSENDIELMYNGDIDNSFTSDSFSSVDFSELDYSEVVKAVADVRLYGIEFNNPINEKRNKVRKVLKLLK